MSDGISEARRHEEEVRKVGEAADALADALHEAKDRIFPIDTSFIMEVNEALRAKGLGVELVRKTR